MGKLFKICSIRIPWELYRRISAVRAESGRYKSMAQFVEMALLRLTTFEEGELKKKKRQEEMLRGQQTDLFGGSESRKG